MSTNQVYNNLSTAAATMTSKVSLIKLTRSSMENLLKDNKVNKHVKLETLIQYIEQLKNEPVKIYMEESRSFLSQLLPEFEGDKEYYLPWVRFLDIAYVHKMNKDSDEEDAFKKGIEEIISKLLRKDKKTNSIEWRIVRKILSLNGHFSLTNSDLKDVQEGILKAFKAEIEIALEHLLWQKESLFVDSTKTALISLRQCYERPADQDGGRNGLLEALQCGRFDKEKFNLKNSLIIGEDGGLYMLLNRMNQQQQDGLVAEQVVTKDYLKDKIKAKDQRTGDKIVLGTGGFGTVRFAMSLLRSRSLPAEIVCVKKTRSFQDLGGSFKPTPLEQVTESTLGDYFTNNRAQAIYSPCILDMTLVTLKSVIKDDGRDHRKGYLMMEILPQNTATRIFADERYQKWEYQKPYLLDVLENTQKLLESDIAMTDLKPDNTLYETDTRKATIIDLGGSVKVANSKELLAFDLTKYSIQSTPEFRAPELSGNQGIINIQKALAYSCGKVIKAITYKSDYDQQAISQITKKLTASEPQVRISIPEAITEIKQMGYNSYRKNIIFSHYISKVKDRLENKKSAISINEDIEKTRELFITLNSTSSDPSKHKNLKTEDLFKKIDDFLTCENTKQVMAIFGVAGSGKSIALQLKFIQAVNSWQPGQPLPIYFNLANGLDLDQIVRTLNTELDTNLSLESLDGQHLYIDSFDEGLGIEHKRETLIKGYLRQLGSPKILITCRTDYLQDNSYDWFSPESKEFEVCYVAPINYNGHQDLSNMVEKYVSYSKQHSSVQHTNQDYLNRLKELQLTDLVDTGFMFFLVMEVLFQLKDKKEGRVNKVDIYASYISYYQNNQISQLKNQDQKKKLQEMALLWGSNNRQSELCSFASEIGKYLACEMHLNGQVRLGESDKLFATFNYDSSLLFKHQSIIHLLKLLPLKIVTTHSGKWLISNQEVKIGFIHDIIKNYYLLEAIKSEIEREGKSQILASKSIIHDSELMKMIALAMKDNPQLTASFLKAIEISKHDKSTSSVTLASNSISLLVAAQHSFSGCDLSSIAVTGANIVNGIFHNANLDSADLSNADMSNVNLIGASLNNADMRGVNFSIYPDLVGHKSAVINASFSPDGKFLESVSSDGVIKTWDPSTGECLRTVKAQSDALRRASFSPDGKLLASGSEDKKIKIWDLSTGRCLRTFKAHSEDIFCVCFSSDGKFLASASDDKTIKIWNPSTGECMQTLKGHTDWVITVSFSPDGKFLASGSGDKTIKIWNPSTGECLKTLDGDGGLVYSVCFSPDSKLLASGFEYQMIKMWNPSTGDCLQILGGHADPVRCFNFSSDGKFLVSGSSDKTAKIWNLSTGECLQTLNGHTDVVMTVNFSPDGKLLQSASYDCTIKIWNSSAGECLQTLKGHTDWVRSISFTPDGKFFASGSEDGIKIWNPSTGEHLQTLDDGSSCVTSVSFSPDGKFLASGTSRQTIMIWNPSTSECLKTLNGHTDVVTTVSFSPDGKFLASGSDDKDKTIKIWNPSTGECLRTLKGHRQMVTSVSFSPDGKFLASGSYDEKIKIWNPSTGECLQTFSIFNRHRLVVCSVSFSPDGKFLVSGSLDKTIKIWNPSTGKCLRTLEGHTECVNSVIFSSDGKFLASASDDKTLKIWDPSTGKCLETLKGYTGWVRCVSFSPDDKFLVSGSDTTIEVLEAGRNGWLLKNHLTASPSPLVADGATLAKALISDNNKLILTQKGAVDPTVHSNDIQLNIRNQSHCCQVFAIPAIIYDNPLLNNPVLFAQMSQILGPIQALKLSKPNMSIDNKL